MRGCDIFYVAWSRCEINSRIDRKCLSSSHQLGQFVWPWWRHQMEKFSALLALCAGNSPVSGEFPSQRPVARGFYVFFDLCLNKRWSEQSRRRWFETPSRSLWRHRNDMTKMEINITLMETPRDTDGTLAFGGLRIKTWKIIEPNHSVVRKRLW